MIKQIGWAAIEHQDNTRKQPSMITIARTLVPLIPDKYSSRMGGPEERLQDDDVSAPNSAAIFRSR